MSATFDVLVMLQPRQIPEEVVLYLPVGSENVENTICPDESNVKARGIKINNNFFIRQDQG